MKDIRLYIRKLPISSSRKIGLYNAIQRVYHKVKYSSADYKSIKSSSTFVPTNGYYGHEYWLKRYSGYNDYIYGMIEHGVYFGDNMNKVGQEEEWDLGSIITYGDSRIKLLNKLYPDYHIFGVGPRIHYVDIDLDYYDEIKAKIDASGKTMVLYPHHSLYKKASEYNLDSFIKEANDIAKELDISNILVSLHPADIAHGFDKRYEGRHFLTVTGGINQVNFLPRLKAILKVADITYSNTLGTHIGYSIYEGKPVVMDIRSNMSVIKNEVFKNEQLSFARLFNGNNPFTITKEQWELCDFYFGFSHIKTPSDLNAEFQKCKTEYERRFK